MLVILVFWVALSIVIAGETLLVWITLLPGLMIVLHWFYCWVMVPVLMPSGDDPA
ncbi:hypothetical protein RAZWK3B_20556 [Roseobacter sp. AzwK-3b]|uniref:hypothetical protein n=1 Tax=Roseobacter sp. AzwK-3b TaxID=351016 RepID=UPI0001569AD5|nr:hypothetical protein [Roseobacter sp. AzwK-3b]EDM71782.1 hypothetical protein RAZWK3B_20556 [Roseobacter sp. AzwK-3b]